MNIIQDFKNPSGMTLLAKLAYILLFAALLWLTGAPMFLNHAKASQLTTLSDTLSDSNMSVAASSTVRFTLTSNIGNAGSIIVNLDPTTGLFTEAFTAATSSEFSLNAGGTYYAIVPAVASCTAGNQAYITGNYNGGTNTENVTYTLCSAAAGIATSTIITLGMGTSSGSVLINPASTGSYIIRISTTGNTGYTNSGDARVAIISNVTVTASVDTSFTFTISGMATTTAVNGTTTTNGSTATLIPFYNAADTRGALAVNKPEVASQRLNVTTNASNGFTVTVRASGASNGGALTSSAGDDIDFFKDGGRTSSPIAWTAPANTLNQENTYGHFGVTSSDSDLVGGAFGSNNWAGNFFSTTTRAVFSNSGPSDGTATDIGSTTVGYAIQIGSLQQAGSDYQTTITYVATPVF